PGGWIVGQGDMQSLWAVRARLRHDTAANAAHVAAPSTELERVVTHWHPRLDLDRLLVALSEEILAATDEEGRAAAAQGRKIASAAREVRLLVEAACADADEDLDRNLSGNGIEKDLDEKAFGERALDEKALDEDLVEPAARPRPAGALRRGSHHQRH